MATKNLLQSQLDVPKISTRLMENEKKPKKFKVKKVMPFTLYCEHCNFCVEKGNKIDAVKKEAGWEKVFDIPIWRFQFKCYSCSSPFSIKFDAGRNEHIIEYGATLISKKTHSST
ncbi:Family of unknown function (DUF572) [Abeliophyllum distichum]|uniref:Uncharacterized protein n=1 Tax=Abeliophyllum distichum TaxID=126358 RepID=A0ABD1QA17_9LAMI